MCEKNENVFEEGQPKNRKLENAETNAEQKPNFFNRRIRGELSHRPLHTPRFHKKKGTHHTHFCALYGV